MTADVGVDFEVEVLEVFGGLGGGLGFLAGEFGGAVEVAVEGFEGFEVGAVGCDDVVEEGRCWC